MSENVVAFLLKKMLICDIIKNANEKGGKTLKSIEEMRKSYNSFIERQRVGYEMTAAMIGYIVEKMKNANIISNEVSISGRIKSFKSAYENTGKKAVDDCFGIRIIGPMDDLRKIQAVIESEFTVDATKDHSRKVNSSYNAIHEMLHMKRMYASKSEVNYETFPEVEIQYWDEELRKKCVYGELAYSKYKSKDLIDILDRLEKDRERVLSDLPVFYMIEGREITRLSEQEALYKMYPEIEKIEKGRKKVIGQVESNQEEEQAI